MNHPAYFTTAYFHRPEDLAAEVHHAGFGDEAWDNPAQRQSLMEFLRMIEREPSVQGASAHIMAVAQS
jgi:hypothetical protein